MFTGLIEEVGRLRSVRPRGDGATLVVEAERVLEGLELGDSIAISGPCQTVVAFDGQTFTVEAIKETMERTRFGSFRTGTRVNLERALTPQQRMGGHFVQGHVDGLAEILDIRKLAGSWRVSIKLPEEGKPYVVEKGSVALDGVSLTVAARKPDSFDVEIIPHTWEATTLQDWSVGGRIHLEYDILAKYVSHMLGAYAGGSGLSMEKLMQSGFGGL